MDHAQVIIVDDSMRIIPEHIPLCFYYPVHRKVLTLLTLEFVSFPFHLLETFYQTNLSHN